MSPARKRLYVALTCATLGMVTGASLAPRTGAKWISGWTGDFLGHSAVTLGAAGAGIGLLIGLALAWRLGREPAPEAHEPGDIPAPPKKRRWKAPKRFGARGQ